MQILKQTTVMLGDAIGVGKFLWKLINSKHLEKLIARMHSEGIFKPLWKIIVMFLNISLTLCRKGIFGATHGFGDEGGGGLKTPHAPYNLSEISLNDETRHSYTVPKEDPKNI